MQLDIWLDIQLDIWSETSSPRLRISARFLNFDKKKIYQISMDFRFFVKKNKFGHIFISFSREIGSHIIQTSLFLEKYAPRPSRPVHFFRDTRPRQGTQAISREMHLFNRRNMKKTMVFLTGSNPTTAAHSSSPLKPPEPIQQSCLGIK